MIRLRHIDFATARMPAMVAFYEQVFGMVFTQVLIADYLHFVADLGGIEFSLAPNTYANVSATAEGIHQFIVDVDHLHGFAARALAAGVTIRDSGTSLSLNDPDGNPWILTQARS